MENQIELLGELKEEKLSIQHLGALNLSLGKVYRYKDEIADMPIADDLEKVLCMASDFLCNLCHELHINPFILDYWKPGEDHITYPHELDDY